MKRCEVFLGLDDSELQKLVDLPSCQEQVYEAQGIIFEEGKEAQYIYVLEEGQVSLTVKIPTSLSQPSKETVVRTITKGGTFGWSALVPPHVLTMSAICKQPSKVVAIRGNELYTLFDRDRHLGYEVLSCLLLIIGSRVRDIEQMLITGKRSPFLKKSKKV